MTRHPAAVALLCSVCLLGHPRAGTTIYGFDRGGQQDLVVDTRPSADDPDLLIFDLVGGNVHNPPPGADDPDLLILDFLGGNAHVVGGSGDDVILITGSGIHMPDGGSCTFDASGPLLRLRDEQGRAVYTAWLSWVLPGDFEVPPAAGGIAGATEFWFHGAGVYADLPTKRNLVATASADVQFASDALKLLVVAVIVDACSRDPRPRVPLDGGR